jgi:hypothetical protein
MKRTASTFYSFEIRRHVCWHIGIKVSHELATSFFKTVQEDYPQHEDSQLSQNTDKTNPDGVILWQILILITIAVRISNHVQEMWLHIYKGNLSVSLH